jgi:hypothetical protein
MKTYIERILAKDFAGAGEFYAADIVAHQSGRGPWSGNFQGKAAFMEALAGMTGSVDTLDIAHHALTVGDGHAVVLNRLTITKGDDTFQGNRVVVYHLGDNEITELWVVDQDQQGLDEFLA